MLLSKAELTAEETQTILRLLQITIPIKNRTYISLHLEMPYEVAPVKGGYKVRKTQKEPSGRYKYFSTMPLTKARAEAQMKALYASEARKSASGRKK